MPCAKNCSPIGAASKDKRRADAATPLRGEDDPATLIQSSTGALVPRTSPKRSLARTAKYRSEVCANMAVSKSSRGTDPKDSSWLALGPASTSQIDTSVAPFQLA